MDRGPTFGLTLGVYKRAGDRADCTLGGISSTATELTLVGHHVQNVTPPIELLGGKAGLERIVPLHRNSRVFEASDAKPPVAIYIRDFGDGGKMAHIVPATWIESAQTYIVEIRWTMFGGNYADRGDSRVCELLDDLLGHRFYGALAIHDRIES